MTNEQRSPCRYCAEGHPNDIGGSYARQSCEASWLRNEIAELERDRASFHVTSEDSIEIDERIRVYRRRLEAAEYVGD